MPAPSNILFPSRLHLLNLPQTTLPTENQVFKCLSLCGTFLIQITAPIKLCLLRNVLVRIWYLFWTLADSSDLFHSLILSCMFAVDSLGCVVIRSTNLHPSPFILTWLLCESSYTVANEFRSFEKRTGTIHFITWLSLPPPHLQSWYWGSELEVGTMSSLPTSEANTVGAEHPVEGLQWPEFFSLCLSWYGTRIS